jgi:hypothetical protein
VIRCCSTCRWWDEDGAQFANATREVSPRSGVGICEVDRPQCVTLPNGLIVSVFPTTHGDRACGRWAAPADSGPDDGERADVVSLRMVA